MFLLEAHLKIKAKLPEYSEQDAMQIAIRGQKKEEVIFTSLIYHVSHYSPFNYNRLFSLP